MITIVAAHGRVRQAAAYAACGRRGVNGKIKTILSFVKKETTEKKKKRKHLGNAGSGEFQDQSLVA